jgi:molybdate transport system substrate-binding protein
MIRAWGAVLVGMMMIGGAQAETITVFAASSLKGALDRAVVAWSTVTGNEAVVSYGSSGTLAKQIEAGAPADVFLSAASDWMDAVAPLMVPDSRVDLWGNGLSIIAHDMAAAPFVVDETMDLAQLLGGERLAIANVTSAPAGQYGMEALTNLGQWDKVEAQVVQTMDDAATVTLVETGAVAYGLVYTTDAVAAVVEGRGVKVSRLPEDSHKPIVYPGAVLTSSTKAAAAGFLKFLTTPAGTDPFAAQGFTILSR